MVAGKLVQRGNATTGFKTRFPAPVVFDAALDTVNPALEQLLEHQNATEVPSDAVQSSRLLLQESERKKAVTKRLAEIKGRIDATFSSYATDEGDGDGNDAASSALDYGKLILRPRLRELLKHMQRI